MCCLCSLGLDIVYREMHLNTTPHASPSHCHGKMSHIWAIWANFRRKIVYLIFFFFSATVEKYW